MMAATRKHSGRKAAAKKPRTRRGTTKATPPPDDPLRRHEELGVDRRIEGQTTVVESASFLSAMAGATGRRRPTIKATRTSTIASQCKLRLRALSEARGLTSDRVGPVRVRRRVLSLTAPGGVDLVPPVAGTSNWVQLGPTAIPLGQTYSPPTRVLVTGRVTAIAVDPTNSNVIYIGAAQGGVWKTSDGGLNWKPKSDNEVSLAIGALAMDPSNPQILYAGTGEGNFSGDSYYGNGVLKTIDGGNTWTTLGQTVFAGVRFGRIAVTPGMPSRLFAATSNGLYRSTDAGVTWTKLTGSLLPGLNATDVCIDPSSPTTVYAAFWSGGVFKTTNANAAGQPTWTKLAGGLPSSGFTRIALGLSASSPQTLYALMAGPANTYFIDKFLRSTDAGATWTSIALPGGNIGRQGFYNLDVAVDPTTPDIVFFGGISVWKAVRTPATGAWTITNVGSTIHPDHHALTFDPANHLTVYAGNDGGIYKSLDGGATWIDTINEGPCITQFEFIDHHPTSDAVVFGGTQDNGTEQYRNSPVFNHADDGDGGYCAVDRLQPNNILSTYYGPSPKRSTEGGEFGTWFDVSGGITGSSLFYPPLALDQTNPNNIALGTTLINLDAAQGAGGWPTKVPLPGITDLVSAIHYVNSSLIYAGTSDGQIYRLVKSGATWTATSIGAPPLPGQFIWDVTARPDDVNTIIVVMSGFGISHVWRGVVAAGGTSATWTDISGTAGGTLPDIPVNALVIDSTAPNTYYIATDVAVFRTTNAGTTWTQFSQGLPNCAVFDLRLHQPTRLLRAATHGRGLWERKLDVASASDADLYFRDHVMATGRQLPSPSGVPAAFADPLQHVALGDELWWWQCADVKMDALEGSAPDYQMPVAAVDYVAFESQLQHRHAQRGRVNRIYVQLHNRGIADAVNVTVKLLYADASAGLPPLPSDFWTTFPNDSSNTTNWKPIGTAKVVPAVSPAEPTVVEWDWSTPPTASDHSCVLVVMDSVSDPIPAASKVFDVGALVQNEKRVGLRNLHIVNASPGSSLAVPVQLLSTKGIARAVRVHPTGVSGWSLGLLWPKSATVPSALKRVAATPARATRRRDATKVPDWIAKKLTKAALKMLKAQMGDELARFDTTTLYALQATGKGAQLENVRIPKAGLRVLLIATAPKTSKGTAKVNIVHEEEGRIAGGNTFVFLSK